MRSLGVAEYTHWAASSVHVTAVQNRSDLKGNWEVSCPQDTACHPYLQIG